MNKRVQLAVLIALLVPLIAAGCSTSFIQTQAPASGVPTLNVGSTNPQGAPGQTNAPVATGENSTGQLPICQATASCAALNAEQIPLSCVKKVPYTNVLVPKGTTFQVLDNTGEFACADSGVVVNDKQVITCHGKELFSFQLKLSNASCGGSLQAGTGQCQDGYGYDAAQQCCAPVSADGSATVTVNLGACPLPNP